MSGIKQLSLNYSIQLSDRGEFNEGNAVFCLVEHLSDEAQWTDGFGGS